MTYENFIEQLLAYRKFYRDTSKLYEMGFDFMEGKFKLTEPVDMMLKSCIKSHLTEFSRSLQSKSPESYTSVPDSVSVTTPCFALLRLAPLHPLCAFTQKQNTLYNWSGKEWSILSNELLQQYILGIARKFLVIFIRWNNINRSEIDQCETQQDQQITYMFKINSAQSANEKCVREIKKWLCQTFETKLGPTIEYA